ncbi:hypothetical protein, partial [Longimicrobium sp.]|uniref:hypothetical protein n=1 Tax=Longimicrobium sp. TaxID=2029185 RepID=UPI002E35EEE6
VVTPAAKGGRGWIAAFRSPWADVCRRCASIMCRGLQRPFTRTFNVASTPVFNLRIWRKRLIL